VAQLSQVGHYTHALRRGLHVLRRRRARILAYHSISDQRTDRWSIGRRQFERHVQLLRVSGMTVVSLEELVCRMQLGSSLEKMVAITFDDGYCDFLEHAVPILRDYELPATVFVPVARLGGISAWSQFVSDATIMTSEQLERVLQQGFAIGSHSTSHRRLPTLPDADLHEEINGSWRWLRENFGLDWVAFAYPFGDFTERERLAVQMAGYGCAVGFGGLWGNGPETNLFELNRDAITRSCDDSAFQSLLGGWNDWAVATRSVLRL
jgi:peptidoglycan/xylan/chitin deacetylase (PgdA/CDA1 family)